MSNRLGQFCVFMAACALYLLAVARSLMEGSALTDMFVGACFLMLMAIYLRGSDE